MVLSDYFPDLRLDPNARFYSHQFGSVKPHKDGNHDGLCNYTLLIYLSDEFEGGKLSIKMKRSMEEMREAEPDKKHKVFTFNPMMGYGVVFSKDLLHWADELFEGEKNILLIHLYSKF